MKKVLQELLKLVDEWMVVTVLVLLVALVAARILFLAFDPGYRQLERERAERLRDAGFVEEDFE